MAQNISPGVYFSFSDVPAIGINQAESKSFIAFFSDMGPDNELTYVTNENELSIFGSSNFIKYGPSFGQGLLNAKNLVKNGSGVYAMRVLPQNATTSNLSVNIGFDTTTSNINTEFAQEANLVQRDEDFVSTAYLAKTAPANFTAYFPACIFYAKGRGEWYNRLSFRFVPILNKTNVYSLDIYYRTDNNVLNLIEFFEVSFDKNQLSDDQQSLFITDVLEQQSNYLRCYVNDQLTQDELTQWVLTNSAPGFFTNIEDALADEPTSPIVATYFVKFGARGVNWVGQDGNFATWNGTAWSFTPAPIGAIMKTTSGDVLAHFGTGLTNKYNPYLHDMLFLGGYENYGGFGSTTLDQKELGQGSDGNIWTAGSSLINTNNATTALVKAYSGILDPKVLDTENIPFDIVYDAGYPVLVKQAIHDLCKYMRKDCIGFLDSSDVNNVNNAINDRYQNLPYNTSYVSIWANYSKISDLDSGRDLWVSPTYHLSYVVPSSELSAGIYKPFVGERRGVAEEVKSLRFVPNQNERDNLYLAQVNYLTYYRKRPMFWQELTSQMIPSPLQRIYATRIVLTTGRALTNYCRKFNYEFNDKMTWDEIKSDISSYLENIRASRALKSYTVNVGATEYEEKRGIAHVDIILEITGIIEKIYIRELVK